MEYSRFCTLLAFAATISFLVLLARADGPIAVNDFYGDDWFGPKHRTGPLELRLIR